MISPFLLPEADPLLHQISTKWDFEVDGDPSELVAEMIELMLAHKGIGLAAPQCGILKNIFVMGSAANVIVCINPVVLSASTEMSKAQEGCLSFPDLWLTVNRPETVDVQFQTVNGELTTHTYTGLMSRVFLHENDHLLGITFDERVSKLGLKLAQERRIKMLKKLTRKSNNI